jgi:nucleotide-binding universal stress UspA family protein
MEAAAGQKDPYRVVVGVDGSEEAVAALAWAVEEARLRGGEVLAVTAWDFPAMTAGGMDGITTDAAAYTRAAEHVLDVALHGAESSGVEAHRLVTRGHPSEVLLQAARDADLLVVGSRGHGGFAGLLLGSVSAQVVHHSPCTVVVVRPRRHRRG